MAFLQADMDLTLELGQSRRLFRQRQLLEVRRSLGIEAEFGVGREAGIHRGGERREFRFQGGRKILALFGNAKGGAVACQPRFALGPGRELGAVVGEGFGPHDE